LSEPRPSGHENSRSYSAFFGIIPIIDKVFLLMCQDVQTVCTIENKEIYQVVATNFVPFEVIMTPVYLENRPTTFFTMLPLREK
jgi:hypothetical protein